jgi:hypothetical protein
MLSVRYSRCDVCSTYGEGQGSIVNVVAKSVATTAIVHGSIQRMTTAKFKPPIRVYSAAWL